MVDAGGLHESPRQGPRGGDLSAHTHSFYLCIGQRARQDIDLDEERRRLSSPISTYSFLPSLSFHGNGTPYMCVYYPS